MVTYCYLEDSEDEEDKQPQLSCGLRGSCKSARQGLGFPASEPDAPGTPRPYLPPELVRLIDAIMRAAERAEMLRAMNGGNLSRTLRDAARAGGLLDARFLLTAGADAGAEDGWALHAACECGHIHVAEALLDAGSTLTSDDRNVALLYAAYAGHTACCGLLDVRFLLAAGADAGAVAGSALYEACIGGHPLVAQALLDAGGTLTPYHRIEALRYAASNGRTACCELLLDRGADIHYRDGAGDTLWIAAAEWPP